MHSNLNSESDSPKPMPEKEETPERMVSATFRISRSHHDVIQEDARKKKVSVNTIVGQLLELYVHGERTVHEVGAVRITAPNLRQLLEAVPEQRLAESGRVAGGEMVRSIMKAKGGAVSLEAALDYLKGMSKYGGYAEYNEVRRDHKKVIVLMHALGPAGSAYLGSYFRSVLEPVEGRAKVTTTEDAVVIELPSGP